MNKETWDEAQQFVYLLFTFGMWIMFEYWCMKDSEYASQPFTGTIRLVLTNLVTGLFTYIYTKSQPNGKLKQGE